MAPFVFIICLDYVLKMLLDLMKGNGSTKARSKWYPTETDADYADIFVLFANTPVQAKSLLHSLEQVVIGLYVNSDKPNKHIHPNTLGISFFIFFNPSKKKRKEKKLLVRLRTLQY